MALFPPEIYYYGDQLYIEDYEVHNYSEFGKVIQSACNHLLSDVVAKFDCGFQDGGCLMLAKAFERWSSGKLELYFIANSKIPHIVQHVIASYGGELFIDSDGIGTQEDFLQKSRLLEGMETVEIHKVDSKTNLTGILDNEDYIQHLAAEIKKEIGEYADLEFEKVINNQKAGLKI